MQVLLAREGMQDRYVFHFVLSRRMPLCSSLSTSTAHASMHFTVYFPCACLYASHCLLSLRVRHCLLSLRMPLVYSFHCLLSLRMHLCISLPTFPMQLSCPECNGFSTRTLGNAFSRKQVCCRCTKRALAELEDCSYSHSLRVWVRVRLEPTSITKALQKLVLCWA